MSRLKIESYKPTWPSASKELHDKNVNNSHYYWRKTYLGGGPTSNVKGPEQIAARGLWHI
jgi:hypothetical protein